MGTSAYAGKGFKGGARGSGERPIGASSWLCQQGPWTVPVSLRCVRSPQRRATALAIGQGRPGKHPIPAVEEPSPMAAFGP